MPAERKRAQAARPDAVAISAARQPLQMGRVSSNNEVYRGLTLRGEEQELREGHGTKAKVREFVKLLLDMVDEMYFDCPDDQREIIRENIEIAVVEGLQNNRVRPIFLPTLPPPVRSLSEDEIAAVTEVGRLHSWEDRSVGDKRSPMHWVMEHYGSWVPGLLKSHIKLADPKLYAAFMTHIGRHGMTYIPAGKSVDEAITVDIPSAASNEARQASAANATDQEYYDGLRRRLQAERLRSWRHAANG
jgi:hypothetical protein